jgi:hypothetical protein
MVKFKVEVNEEGDDHSWSQLIVKTPDRDWHSADLTYGTEDQNVIRSIIANQNMKTQTITIHTRLQDNGDGGYTFYGYPSEDSLIEDHFLNDGNMTDELRQEILDEENPYENGYIGTETIEIGIDENGVAHLIGNLSFHAGQ